MKTKPKNRLQATADITRDQSHITIQINLGPLIKLLPPAKKLITLITRKP